MLKKHVSDNWKSFLDCDTLGYPKRKFIWEGKLQELLGDFRIYTDRKVLLEKYLCHIVFPENTIMYRSIEVSIGKKVKYVRKYLLGGKMPFMNAYSCMQCISESVSEKLSLKNVYWKLRINKQ